MSLQAYQVAQQTVETARQTEYRLFARVTSALMQANPTDYPNFAKAIDWNRRLWLTLQTDCADSGNLLPEPVRAGIISLGIWVEKHSRKAAKREADLKPLIEINRIIMEGLAGTAPSSAGRPAHRPSGRRRRATHRYTAKRRGSMESVRALSPTASSSQMDVVQREPGNRRTHAEVRNMTHATDPGNGNAPSRVGELHRLAAQVFAKENLKLSIRYHEGSGRFVYRGLNPETGEVVREYPPEEVLRRVAELHATLEGLSVDRRS